MLKIEFKMNFRIQHWRRAKPETFVNFQFFDTLKSFFKFLYSKIIFRWPGPNLARLDFNPRLKTRYVQVGN